MSTQHDLERELEEFLNQQHSPVADLYHKLSQPQPDVQLDQQVLKLAREALMEDTAAQTAPLRPRSAARRNHRRWPVALGSAASVVFAAGLAVHFGTENWQAQNHAPAGAASSSASDVVHVRSIDMPEAKPVASEAMPTPAPAPPAAAAKSETADFAAMNAATYKHKKTVSVSQPAPVAAPAPPQATQQLEADKPVSQPLETTEATGSRIRRVDVEGAAQISGAPGFARDPGTVNKPAQTALSQSDTQTKDERDAVERKLDIATGRDAAMRARNADALKPQVAGVMRESAAPATAAAPTPAKPAAMQSSAVSNAVAAAPPPLPIASAAAAAVPGADAWIAKIRAQLQAGQRHEAVRNLEQFREKYPDYELAPDLRQLLP